MPHLLATMNTSTPWLLRFGMLFIKNVLLWKLGLSETKTLAFHSTSLTLSASHYGLKRWHKFAVYFRFNTDPCPKEILFRYWCRWWPTSCLTIGRTSISKASTPWRSWPTSTTCMRSMLQRLQSTRRWRRTHQPTPSSVAASTTLQGTEFLERWQI